MYPILYSRDTVNADFFDNNGLGFLKNCIECEVTEGLNDSYELDMRVLDVDRLYQQIEPRTFVKVRANPIDEPQIFEIYNVQKNGHEMRVLGEHIRYRMTGNAFTEPYGTSTAMTPAELWEDAQEYLVAPNDFSFYSDITRKNKVNAGDSAPIRLGDFLLGHYGSVLDSFNGEYKFDNFDVFFNTRRGKDTGVCLRLGSGIKELRYEAASDQVYTDLFPYARIPYKEYGTDFVIGDMFVATLEPIHISDELSYTRVVTKDFTDEFTQVYPNAALIRQSGAPSNYVEIRNMVKTLAENYVNINRSKLSETQVNISITTYNHLEQLQRCELGDVIQVFYETNRDKVELTAKIVKATYDVIREKYTSVEVGAPRRKMSSLFDKKILR